MQAFSHAHVNVHMHTYTRTYIMYINILKCAMSLVFEHQTRIRYREYLHLHTGERVLSVLMSVCVTLTCKRDALIYRCVLRVHNTFSW